MSTLLLLLPSMLASASAQPAPVIGAPLPATVLNGISQDLDDLNAALDAETDLSHVGEELEGEPKWTGGVFAGLTIATGNTEQTNASITADAELRRADDRTTLLAFWNYADQTDQDTNESSIVERNVGWKAQYDYYMSPELYTYGNASGLQDTQKNLDLRLTIGLGAGYQAFEDDKKALGLEAGLAYVSEDFEGQDSDVDYAAGRIAYVYRHHFTETTTFHQVAESTLSLEDSDDVIVRVTTDLEVLISSSLTATVQHVFDYDNTPVPGNERVDQRLAFGVTWVF